MLIQQKIADLPENLKIWVDPQKPLPQKDRFDPIPHIYLNMARLVTVLTFSVGWISFLLALVSHSEKTQYNAVVAAIGTLALALVIFLYRRHSQAGGDLHRRGTYLLKEGMLIIREDKGGLCFDYLPREEIQGFACSAFGKDTAGTLSPQTVHGTHREFSLPTMEVLESWHRRCLNTWLETGDFSWYEYKHAQSGEA